MYQLNIDIIWKESLSNGHDKMIKGNEHNVQEQIEVFLQQLKPLKQLVLFLHFLIDDRRHFPDDVSS